MYVTFGIVHRKTTRRRRSTTSVLLYEGTKNEDPQVTTLRERERDWREKMEREREREYTSPVTRCHTTQYVSLLSPLSSLLSPLSSRQNITETWLIRDLSHIHSSKASVLSRSRV
jgi:hypothetical protein